MALRRVFKIRLLLIVLVAISNVSLGQYGGKLKNYLRHFKIYSTDSKTLGIGLEDMKFHTGINIEDKEINFKQAARQVRFRRESDGEKDCKDVYPYCDRYVKIYGLDPPFTLCDEDWFINGEGKYGCKQSCNLC